MKEIYELNGQGYSAREIARTLDLARNTVLRYLKDPEAMVPKGRSPRGSKLDPYADYIDGRMSEGLENCVVLLRELRVRGYAGSYTTLSEYVRPRRRSRQPQATVRFETEPGEQAQVDWGSFSYVDEKGRKRRVWAFVMVLSWSRSIYVEFVRRADTASFIQCHVNAFDYLGGVPRRCLYDNAKVVTLGRDEEGRTEWNRRMLDFALRLGFELKLCQPYRAQTKGKVESGVKYVRGNLWPSMRFTDDADLNRQTLGVVRRRGQPATTRDNPPSPCRDAGRGAASPGEAAGTERSGAIPQGGPDGSAGRVRQLGGLPLRGSLAVGRRHGAGGPAAGHRGDLGRRPAPSGASEIAESRPALHHARPVGGSSQSRRPSGQRGIGGAGPGG